MFKSLKEYLHNWITVIFSSIIGLSIFTKVLVGGIAFLSTLVLWLTYQVFIPSGNTIIDPRSLIVHQVKDVSELATAIFQAEKVISVSKRDGFLESKLLYIAHGEVRVGIDLSEFKDEDVQINENKIIVNLPPLRILDTKLDVNKSGVYDYDTGFWKLGPDVIKLQEQAQRNAIGAIKEAACEDWLIKTASARVQQIVERFLNLIIIDKGYSVTVNTQMPSEGSCVKSTSNNSAV